MGQNKTKPKDRKQTGTYKVSSQQQWKQQKRQREFEKRRENINTKAKRQGERDNIANSKIKYKEDLEDKKGRKKILKGKKGEQKIRVESEKSKW